MAMIASTILPGPLGFLAGVGVGVGACWALGAVIAIRARRWLRERPTTNVATSVAASGRPAAHALAEAARYHKADAERLTGMLKHLKRGVQDAVDLLDPAFPDDETARKILYSLVEAEQPTVAASTPAVTAPVGAPDVGVGAGCGAWDVIANRAYPCDTGTPGHNRHEASGYLKADAAGRIRRHQPTVPYRWNARPAQPPGEPGEGCGDG